MWKDDGSNAVETGASSSELVVTAAVQGSPVNALFDQALASGQYFEIEALACEEGPFIGVASGSGFAKGWKIKGLFFGGPGNLSTGSALARGEYGDGVAVGMRVGVLVEFDEQTVTATFYQDGRCLGPAFAARRLTAEPIYPVVQAKEQGDRFLIRYAEAPVERQRQAKAGGTEHPAVGDWKLDSISSMDIASKMPEGARATLRVSSESAKNHFGLHACVCNRINAKAQASGEVTSTGQEIRVSGPVMATMMMGPEDMMEVETAVSAALQGLSHWQVGPETLVLQSSSGEMKLTPDTSREDTTPLTGYDLP
eukprot:TRINITY_DN10693_c0_g1_i1.p1 TRINITY_DN10693_c0_g1~~TRINITY_DN10693_c0_g1_i1.p1  ORF type:complete len:342 (+),score=48.28 TRINITY_DN10693_c0_g1_i1:94-1026(+)